MLWAICASVSIGLALIREGNVADGITHLRAGIAHWEANGGKLRNPHWNAFLAEGMALTGDLDNALQRLDQQVIQIERPRWGERANYAEILRLKGWILSLKGDSEAAERNFLASLDWARRQQAKMWELRTSGSLARLWQSQGKRQEAHELLAPVYDLPGEVFAGNLHHDASPPGGRTRRFARRSRHLAGAKPALIRGRTRRLGRVAGPPRDRCIRLWINRGSSDIAARRRSKRPRWL